MKKNILKHITVEGFAQSTDLSHCEILEKELNETKGRFKLARKDVKDAKNKLNQALEEVINKIEKKKKETKETQRYLVDKPEPSTVFTVDTIKSKYDEAVGVFEIKKDKIKKKIDEYNAEGTESWDSFKHKLNHDLEELGIALKAFVTKSK